MLAEDASHTHIRLVMAVTDILITDWGVTALTNAKLQEAHALLPADEPDVVASCFKRNMSQVKGRAGRGTSSPSSLSR